MPKTPPKTGADLPRDEGKGFLQRWSARKSNAARHGNPPSDRDRPPADIDQAHPAAASDTETANAATDDAPTVTEADLENLTYESDYTRFMSKKVPETLRRQALRQLWRSDPILANIDGLCDYDGDYTDAALVVANLQTAYRVGKGFLTDEELAENRARGNPVDEPETAEAAANEPPEADTTTETSEPAPDQPQAHSPMTEAGPEIEHAAAETSPSPEQQENLADTPAPSSRDT
ncbi:MAG: DUF3306 domain-containing protein [Alphaproteobacteria bacterium]|nr:DUF3306 domain-containing protein [Alphaproteobacteria bacterium]